MYFNENRQEESMLFSLMWELDSYLYISLAQQDSISMRIWFHAQQFIKVSNFKAVNFSTNEHPLEWGVYS